MLTRPIPRPDPRPHPAFTPPSSPYHTLQYFHICGCGAGYCCQYGGGSYYQVRIGNTLLKQGGVFTFVDTYSFANTPTWSFGSIPFNTSYVAYTTHTHAHTHTHARQ